jgi:hypothetical protein
VSTAAETSSGSPTRGPHRVPEVVVLLGVGLAVAALTAIPFLLRHTFYYRGDNPESFVPLWHHFGRQLRSGQWPPMDPAGWSGGNYAAEAAYALWNPVQLLDYVLVSLFDDLAAAAAVVQIQFLALLGMGAYLLFREYGACRVAAAVVALGVPVMGFTLFYEGSGWPAGLMAFTWVTWFWWAAHRQSRGRLVPVVPFVLGALGMTTGNPYAALGMVVVLAGIAVELLARRDHRRLVGLVLTGACVGATAALVFLPLVGTLPVTERQQVAMLANDTFLVPQLGDVAASSAPTYVPAILNWGGALIERLPSTYFLWFALPLLPWVRWHGWRRPDRPVTSVVVAAAVFGALALGPSNLWLFRWPIRLIEYFYLALAVVLALLLSAGLAGDRIRARTLTTVAVVAGGGYLSFAVRPDVALVHVVAALVVLVLVLLAVAAFHRRGPVLSAAVLVVGTLLVVTYQTVQLPLPPPDDPDAVDAADAVVSLPTPVSVAEVRERTSAYRGTVLQLASRASSVTVPDRPAGDLLFGNETLMSGHESIVRYSGMGFAEFIDALCMDYRGQVCPEGLDRALRPAGATGVPLVDLLRVQTLVIDARLFPGPAAEPPPAGWSVAARDDLRTVWVRGPTVGYGGRLSWVSPGVEVLSDTGTGVREEVRFQASRAGTLVFARLTWPGHTATLDGRPVQVLDGPAGLLMIGVPAGRHVLEVDFRSPGSSVGTAALGVAALVHLLPSVAWAVDGLRRRRRRAPLTAADPGPVPEGTRAVPSGREPAVHAGTPQP